MDKENKNNGGHTSLMDSVNSELQLIKVDEALIAEIVEFLSGKEQTNQS